MAFAINVADVLALLRPEHVIAACGIDARERGKAFRLRTCPACGTRPARQGAAIYRRKRDSVWRWTHHGHDCGGDLLDLVAAAEGIDRRREFSKLIGLGAQLAGISSTDRDVERRITERRREEDRARASADAEREEALAAMPGIWDSLLRRSVNGERYLDGRGLDSAALRTIDAVRFTASHEIAVAMRDLDTGDITGIQYRSTIGKAFRMERCSDPSNSALVGKLGDIDPDGVDVAIVVEGLADSLAATLAFPGCAVFGAAGCAHVENIVAALATRVVECRGWLCLSPDDDDASAEHFSDALRVAKDAGLVLDESLRLIDLGAHHDLADAYCAGWRNVWPS